MPGEGTIHETREEGDVCPTCNRRVEENKTAVAYDGICQRWHHLSCAELQLGQFNTLKSMNKRKSKLIWLCYVCEQDFILFKAGKSTQKETEGMRAEMNMKINEMIAAINKLKFEHQTRTFVRNRPAVNQQVTTDEAQVPEIKESKMQLKKRQAIKIWTHKWQTTKQKKAMKKEKKDRTKHRHERAIAKRRRTRWSNTPRHEWRNSPPTMTRGRWRNKKALRK